MVFLKQKRWVDISLSLSLSLSLFVSYALCLYVCPSVPASLCCSGFMFVSVCCSVFMFCSVSRCVSFFYISVALSLYPIVSLFTCLIEFESCTNYESISLGVPLSYTSLFLCSNVSLSHCLFLYLSR
jgi:hypothetical protein